MAQVTWYTFTMASKKRFFKRKKDPTQPQKNLSIGNKSVNIREKEKPVVVKKSINKNKEPIKFPNISQIISEYIHQVSFQKLFLVSSTIFIAILIVWQLIGVAKNAKSFIRVLRERQSLYTEMSLWESIDQKYPTYRDAAFQVAVLAYRLGDKQKESIYLQKVLAIDPNFVPAVSLEKLTN